MADEGGEAAMAAGSETEAATGNEETTEETTAVGADESEAEAAETVRRRHTMDYLTWIALGVELVMVFERW